MKPTTHENQRLLGAGLLCTVVVAFLPVLALAQGRVGRPAAGGPPTTTGRTGMVERLHNALDAVELTDDQRVKVNALLDDTTKSLQEAAREQDPNARPGKLRNTMQQMRQQLAQLLTPDQLQSLRQRMQQTAAGAGGAGRFRPPNRNPTDAIPPAKPATQPNADTTEMMSEMQATPAKTRTAPPPSSDTASVSKLIDAGQVAPDFTLKKLDGSTVPLSSLKGRVVVLVFGSYSNPIFRGRAASIEHMEHDLGTTASVLLIYTREANPVGGWEVQRNQEDNIKIAQPATYRAREAVARQCRDALHLSLPILLDDMDNTVTAAYGTFPNGAVVINRDGTVAASQQWVESSALKRYVTEAAAKEYHKSEKPNGDG